MSADQKGIGLSAGMEAERYRLEIGPERGDGMEERSAPRNRQSCFKKKPLLPPGQEGCVWLEKITELLLRRLLGRLISGAGLRSGLRCRSRLSCWLAGRSCSDAAAGCRG